MEEYWATRTGRWRRAMRGQHGPSLAERLDQVIRKDVDAGQLPAGALLPTSERVAAELTIEPAEVQAAYERLLAAGVLEVRADGNLCIASQGRGTNVGDAITRCASRRRCSRPCAEDSRQRAGTSGITEATGMFKAAMVRLQEMERPKKPQE